MSLAIAVLQDQAPILTVGVLGASQTRALADMRGYLARVKPHSAAESLRLLRNAYPQAPLSLRVAACGL